MNTHPMDYAAIEAQTGLAGNVYFLAPVNFENAAFCKIGRAKNDPEARCAQINKSSTGDVLWGVRHVVTVDDHIRFERLVHQLLASWRNRGAGQRREIFHLPADDAFARACEMLAQLTDIKEIPVVIPAPVVKARRATVFSQKARDQPQPARITLRSMPEFYQGTQIDVRALGDALPQLPGTRSEVKAVARSVHADIADIKLGPDATTIAVKETALDQYRIVYFATHSLVAGDLEKFAKAKAEPALVLSIPEKPTEQDDGLLRASDIAQLKLNADWMVLSACNTAGSDGIGAEALSGLAQAFFMRAHAR